jgi:hypothetical protein
VEINISDDSRASSLLTATVIHLERLPQSVSLATEIVDLRTLDDVAAGFLEGSQSAFLKIDVQGFEDRVLAGAVQIAPRLRGLQVELSFVTVYEGQRLFPEMVSIIDGLGFTLYRMLPVWVDGRTGQWLQADGVFFRR